MIHLDITLRASFTLWEEAGMFPERKVVTPSSGSLAELISWVQIQVLPQIFKKVICRHEANLVFVLEDF